MEPYCGNLGLLREKTGKSPGAPVQQHNKQDIDENSLSGFVTSCWHYNPFCAEPGGPRPMAKTRHNGQTLITRSGFGVKLDPGGTR